MKAKNILMSILLVVGSIAAKAATSYPPELALVSQPVMVYNYNSVTVYYDVENIGDYTYRGSVYIFLDPDDGYAYAEKYVRVCPGRIKRIAIEIPAYRPNPGWVYTIMPYYEMGRELYSFTTFEYFEPLEFWWNGPRNNHWIVINVPPRPRHYTRPNPYRFYYDGYRPPMPPPAGYGPGVPPPPPMDPMHHTYNYHHNNGGYPVHNYTEPTPNNSNTTPNATVRPNPDGGSMSSGSYHSGSNNNTPPTPPVNNNNAGSSSGRTGNHSGTSSNNGRVNSGTSNSGNSTGTSSSGRTGNSGSGRVNSGSNNTGNNSGTSNSGRTGNNSNSRVNNGSSNNRSSGTTNGSSSGRSSRGSGNSGSSSGRSSGTSNSSGSNSGRGGR